MVWFLVGHKTDKIESTVTPSSNLPIHIVSKDLFKIAFQLLKNISFARKITFFKKKKKYLKNHFK